MIYRLAAMKYCTINFTLSLRNLFTHVIGFTWLIFLSQLGNLFPCADNKGSSTKTTNPMICGRGFFHKNQSGKHNCTKLCMYALTLVFFSVVNSADVMRLCIFENRPHFREGCFIITSFFVDAIYRRCAALGGKYTTINFSNLELAN